MKSEVDQAQYVEIDRRMFAEIFWNPLIIMTGLVVGVALFCAAAELHGYSKAGFLATTTVLGSIVTMVGMTASAAVAAFAAGERKIDLNSIYLVALGGFSFFAMLHYIDIAVFKDAAIEGLSTGIPGSVAGAAMLFVPTTSRIKRLIRLRLNR